MMSPFWSIDLADDSTTTPLQFSTTGGQLTRLNEHGLYELAAMPEMPDVLTLLINDTERNNQTVVDCIGSDLETTLFVFGMSQF